MPASKTVSAVFPPTRVSAYSLLCAVNRPRLRRSVANYVDAAGVTAATCEWLLDGRHERFLFSERRQYTDTGGAAQTIEYALTLLASGAVGVGMREIVNFMKAKIRPSEDTPT
jgi:hypothetical protein